MPQTDQRSDENHAAAPAEIERLTQELSRARDMHVRMRADFDNYRKRVQREGDSAAQAGKRQLVLALLDVMDDFERALAYANTAPASILVGARHPSTADGCYGPRAWCPIAALDSRLTLRCTTPST